MTANTADVSLTPDRSTALRVVDKLRSGTTCLDSVSSFSVGRSLLLSTANEQLEELEISRGASVRWIRGRTGQGKTHLFARLIESAHTRNWVTSYVQISEPGYGVELHRFEQVYAAIVRNCLCRDLVETEAGHVEPGRVSGWEWILSAWLNSVRRQVSGREHGDVPTLLLHDTLEQTITAIRRRWSVHASFAAALRQYARAELDGDMEWLALLRSWFEGNDVHAEGKDVRAKLRHAGIAESVNRRNAREMLRSFAAFLQYRGHGGILILIDELENVLHQTPVARRTAWTILRELIDNIDDRHGMNSAAFYVAATPDVFDSAKGMTEYEALAERVLLPGNRSAPNPAASVIDLALWPLRRDDFIQIAGRITRLHCIARSWEAAPTTARNLRDLLDACLKRDPDLTARSWVKEVVERLDLLRGEQAG